jgi:signal transduction histidine kinase
MDFTRLRQGTTGRGAWRNGGSARTGRSGAILLDRTRIRGKIALLVTIPLLALIGVAGPVVYDRVALANRASHTARTVEVAGSIGQLIQELQLERLLAVGYDINQVDRPTLENQIDAVNTNVSKLLSGSAGTLSPQVRVALGRVIQLSMVREQYFALNPSIQWTDTIAAYDTQVNSLIEALRLEQEADVTTAAGRQVVGLDAVLRADESISAAASLLILMVHNPNDSQIFVTYESDLALLQTQAARFAEYCTSAQLQLYNQLQTELSTRLGTVTYIPGSDPRPMLSNEPLSQLFPTMQDFVRTGLQIETKIRDDVTSVVNAQKRTALFTAYGVGGGALLVLVLVGLLSVAVARAVVRPLTRLTQSANRVAKVAQAELVRVADDEVTTTSVVHLDPVDIDAKDEIGDLARAFEEVQGTAAQLVERQAASRRNVAQMFGHVGRRTQNLVARQIALIDWLEREESNPDRLQQLYRLDHVSSRLRRNAQSLVVLSGGEGANTHVNPLPLGDLVRLALGEIEDYTRVDVDVAADLVIAPAAISDMVLILAELMENATAFSPPHTRVTVFAQGLPHGSARLSVVDHGLGLTPERLAEENTRLTARERLDVTPTEVLGLFVVGRLSRRHNLGVSLLATAGGGITATVQIPAELLMAATGPIPAAAGRPAAVPGAPGPVVATRVVARAAVLTGDGQAAEAVNRAIESVRAASAWNAFVPRQRPELPEAPAPLALPQAATSDPVPGPAPAPVVGTPVPAAYSTASVPVEPVAAPPSWPPIAPRPTDDDRLLNRRVPGANLAGIAGAAQAVPATPPTPSPTPSQPPLAPGQPAVPPAASRSTVPGVDAWPQRPSSPPAPEGRTPPPSVPASGTNHGSAHRSAPDPTARPQRVPAAGQLHRRVPGVALDQARGDSQFPTANLSGLPGNPEEVRDLIEQFEAGIFRALSEVRHPSSEEGTTR